MHNQSFVIHGGKHLKGEIEVRGSKNAALPILAATILSEKPSIINNLPLIEDVFRMIDILESMNAKIEWLGKRKVRVDTKNLDPEKINDNLASKLRTSILFVGPILSRFKKFVTKSPGGCNIGARPLDEHLNAFRALGAKIKMKNNTYYFTLDNNTKQETVILGEFSVTATENILMFAALCNKKIRIDLAAYEPHVQDLCLFLSNMGVKISGIGTHTLNIKGAKKLIKGGVHTIIPDYIEAGTFIILAAATKSKINIKNIIPEHLTSVLWAAKRFGVRFELGKNNIVILPSVKLKATKVQVFVYPALATDLQAPFGVLATQAEGISQIQDIQFENRFKYIGELNKMGASGIVSDPHRALITGPTILYGKCIESLDLRAGATLVIAGLIAQGKTEIKNIYQIDRGYEKIDERLQALGANIKRI